MGPSPEDNKTIQKNKILKLVGPFKALTFIYQWPVAMATLETIVGLSHIVRLFLRVFQVQI